MATLADIAKLAGVSISTVSRVLNKDETQFPKITKHSDLLFR